MDTDEQSAYKAGFYCIIKLDEMLTFPTHRRREDTLLIADKIEAVCKIFRVRFNTSNHPPQEKREDRTKEYLPLDGFSYVRQRLLDN